MSSDPAFVRHVRSRHWLPRVHHDADWLPEIPPAFIAGAAALIAVVAGRFMADGKLTLATGLILGICYAPLVLLDLAMALAVYVAILFIQDTTVLSIGPNTMGVLVGLGWVGTVITRSRRPKLLREQPTLVLILALFAVWLTLSLTWAEAPSQTASGLQSWLLAITALIVTATTARSIRDVRIIGVAFVAGAVISVVYGIASGALSEAVTSASETALQGRLTGGGGDPNVQATAFLAGMFLSAGLWGLTRNLLVRLGLLLAFVIITVGFFTTQSRGGFVALVFAALVGLALLPRQRKRIVGLASSACVGLAVVALIKPAALTRLIDVSGGSSGRSDIWKVAWRIFEGHPWVGIGLSNFQAVEPRYTLKVGSLTRVDLIAEAPHLVHNVYLQLLVETGVVGCGIFLLVIIATLRACLIAAQLFDRNGLVAYGDLAQAVLMAAIAMLTAQFFISDGSDWRLWILLGLGPALLSLARRASRRDAKAAPAKRWTAAHKSDPSTALAPSRAALSSERLRFR